MANILSINSLRLFCWFTIAVCYFIGKKLIKCISISNNIFTEDETDSKHYTGCFANLYQYEKGVVVLIKQRILYKTKYILCHYLSYTFQ